MQGEGGERLDIEFSGEGEAVVQARTVHGGVHFHGSKPNALPVPRQLPSGTAVFINRESFLAQLNELFAAWSAEDAATVTSTVVVSAIAGAPGAMPLS